MRRIARGHNGREGEGQRRWGACGGRFGRSQDGRPPRAAVRDIFVFAAKLGVKLYNAVFGPPQLLHETSSLTPLVAVLSARYFTRG